MKQLLLIFCILAPALAQQSGDTKNGTKKGFLDHVNKFSKDVQKEIRDIKHPVEETLTNIGSSQCSNVKKIVGVAYEQIQGEKEPDLNQLSLKFLSNAINISYGINDAARLIPDNPDFDPSKKLYIFIHGFTDDPSKASFSNISDALFSQGECNVLAFDGSSLIQSLYLRSTTYIRFMGEKLGEVLATMVHGGTNPSGIHIIGHSLGAHISSFTGKTFTNLTGLKVGRVTGLDPAGPCFSHVDEDLRLKKSDAEFVDVVHTDGGVYGLKDAVGQVDFYPNDGSQQPNCLFQTCSHSRAWLYFAESVVNPKAFPAIRCKDWESFKKGQCERGPIRYMGFPAEPGSKGLYFLQTADESPYGKGLDGTKYTNDESYVKSIFG